MFLRFLKLTRDCRRVSLLLPLLAAVTAVPCPADPMADGSVNRSLFVDFEQLERPDSPNHWLVAPATVASQLNADAQAPVMGVRAARLAAAWSQVVRNEPRTSIIGVSDDGLRIEAEQRSMLFGFVDRISFQAVALGAAKSSYIAYSRSLTGYWDLGVNRRRLDDWGGALRSALAGDPSG